MIFWISSIIIIYLILAILVASKLGKLLFERGKQMGFYINPRDCSKEEWLSKHGRMVPRNDLTEYTVPAGSHLVCIVDNGAFSAAGIAYDDSEKDAFNSGFVDGSDRRPHYWFLVSDADLISVCPVVERALK